MTEVKISGPEDAQVENLENEELPENPVETFNPLANLRARREKILNDLYIDIPVPRFTEPTLTVRFKPVDTLKMNESVIKNRAAGGADWALKANADVLIESCVGVFATFPDNPERKLSLKPGDIDGPWTKLDKDLDRALGLDSANSIDLVRKLYFTDGDLIATTDRLLKFSGIAGSEADQDF